MAAAAVVCAGAAGGCGAAGTASPAAPAARNRLASDVISVLNHNSIPVMDSFVVCRSRPGRAGDACYGQTNGASEQQIRGLFAVSTGAIPRASSCPGVLTVSVGTSKLQSVRVDPCA